MHQNIDEYLVRADVAIGNGREQPDIVAALEVFGYDDAVLQQGQDLLDAARTLCGEKLARYGIQIGATAALNEARARADRVYSDHRKLAAIAFKDAPEVQAALALDQAKKKSFSTWLTQVRRFYANLLADEEALAAMDRFRITREKLEQAQALVEQTEILNQVQEREKGEAQKATRERDAALDELHEWMNEYKTVAKIALADDAQLLEALQFGVIP